MSVGRATEAVTFSDAAGNVVLREAGQDGRSFAPSTAQQVRGTGDKHGTVVETTGQPDRLVNYTGDAVEVPVNR